MIDRGAARLVRFARISCRAYGLFQVDLDAVGNATDGQRVRQLVDIHRGREGDLPGDGFVLAEAPAIETLCQGGSAHEDVGRDPFRQGPDLEGGGCEGQAYLVAVDRLDPDVRKVDGERLAVQ